MSDKRAGRAGRVVLVGAGPGDPGLLTLRGAAALRECDAVLYDELASPELLDLAPPEAERINVGKRGHDAPTRCQDDINKLLIDLARDGRIVVRLKGGDPFVFGRGGEEASVLEREGIPFEIVPGVSSALAAPAAAGIPITDRRHSASFAVVTGHKDPTRVSRETRWAELGSAVDTLIILMGMRNLGEIVGHLLDGGKDPSTPAAAVMNATLPNQRVVEAPLAELPERVAAAGLGAPAAVVIGDVVQLRSSLGWWEQLPLFGIRVLVTRSADQAGELCDRLRRAGAEPVRVPLLRHEPPEDEAPLAGALAAARDYDAIVFASVNAVRFTARAAERAGVALDSPPPRLLCVGPATARAALDAGIGIHGVASGKSGGGAGALLEELGAFLPIEGSRFLVPRSEIGRDELAAGLRAAGARVDEVVAYRNLPPDVDAAALSRQIVAGEIPIVTVMSPSAATRLVALLDADARSALARCIVAAIGTTTAEALRGEGIEPGVVPERPEVRLLVDAIVAHVHAQRGEEVS